jgi:hypothetical protein
MIDLDPVSNFVSVKKPVVGRRVARLILLLNGKEGQNLSGVERLHRRRP